MPWILACDSAQLQVGTMRRLELADEEIALYHLADGFFATSDTCTHARASLSEGSLRDCVVECPLHGGQFDARTGKAVKLPCVTALQTFATREKDGAVWVEIE